MATLIKKVILFIFCCLLMLFNNLLAQTWNVTTVENKFIFDTASFKACHASTIVKTGDNSLLAAWFGGSFEGSPDVCIWLSHNDGKSWQKPMQIADGKSDDGKTYACWNPVLFKAKDGIVYLHYKVGPNPREWWAMYKTSSDNGATWSSPKPLPAGFLGPIKNKPLQLANGTVLYPSSEESKDEKHWTIHVEKSDAASSNWKKVNISCDTFQAIQPALLFHPDQTIQLLARSKQNVVVQSWSYDNGSTWSKVSATTLPNPNSGIDAAPVNDSLYVLVYNPLLSGKEWWQGRSVLKVALSKDGSGWSDVYTLENETKGEFSYPAVIAEPSGDIYILYTYDRKKIRYVHLKVKRN